MQGHEANEFVSVSDLMAGFVGVIIMLLVVSMAQNAAQADAKRRAEIAALADPNATPEAKLQACLAAKERGEQACEKAKKEQLQVCVDARQSDAVACSQATQQQVQACTNARTLAVQGCTDARLKAQEVAAAERQREREAAAGARQKEFQDYLAKQALAATKPVDDALESLRQTLARDGVDQTLMKVVSRRIRLGDATFTIGSACIDANARRGLLMINKWLLQLIGQNPRLEISVVGHTDSKQVGNKGQLGRCAMFDDNLTLSAGRAREARKLVVEGWPEELSRHVSVSGYGDMQLLDPSDKFAASNRRVEISLNLAPAAMETK